MSVRFPHAVAAIVMAPMLGLPGCAVAPAVVTEAAPAGPFIKLSPQPLRPRRTNPCKTARDLPPERKEALFKQFTAELESDPGLQAAVPVAPVDACKQAAR